MSRDGKDGGQRKGSNDARDDHNHDDAADDRPRGDGMTQTINASSGDIMAAMVEIGRTYRMNGADLISAGMLALAGVVASQDGQRMRNDAVVMVSEDFADAVSSLREAIDV